MAGPLSRASREMTPINRVPLAVIAVNTLLVRLLQLAWCLGLVTQLPHRHPLAATTKMSPLAVPRVGACKRVSAAVSVCMFVLYLHLCAYLHFFLMVSIS